MACYCVHCDRPVGVRDACKGPPSRGGPKSAIIGAAHHKSVAGSAEAVPAQRIIVPAQV